MKNEIILKSGIDLNEEKNMIKIYNYFEKLKQNNENFLNLIRFSKRQIDAKKSFIIEPEKISDTNQSCKDMAFLYDENDEIIGHVYATVSKRRIGFADGLGKVSSYGLSLNKFDFYIPDIIDSYSLLSDYLEARVKNQFEIKYGVFKNEKKL